MKRNSFNAAKLLGAAMLLTLAVTSCKKNNDVSLPPIGGYNTSNDVAAANLLAHWGFEGNANELKSGAAPINSVGVAYGTGIKGQGLNLTNGFLLYPNTITALNTATIGSMSVSVWIKIDNNGSKPSNAFSLTQGTAVQTDWNTGVVNMVIETGHAIATDDTLVLHPSFATYRTGSRLGGDNINDYGNRGTDFQTVHGTNKWVQFIMVYDAVGSNIDAYANGVLVSNNNFRTRTFGNPAVGIGNIVTTTPTQALIGGFANAATGFPLSAVQAFEGLFTGSIDELRFFNKALSASEITSLYQLELAGR